MNRILLTQRAMRAAATVRIQSGNSQASPICIYGVCESLGIIVRFCDVDMEGMYQTGTQPRIHLSAYRPLPRRTYNCAHELGHHYFRHSSKLDELKAEKQNAVAERPEEFLADVFAGFILMPPVGLRHSFSSRGWVAETATEEQFFTVASDFGVGYSTLVTHMGVNTSLLSTSRARLLARTTPKQISSRILGSSETARLVVADQWSTSPVIDVEVDTLVLRPSGTQATSSRLVSVGTIRQGQLFRAVLAGIVRVSAVDRGWAAFVRISRSQYVGLAQYRHLEEDTDEQV